MLIGLLRRRFGINKTEQALFSPRTNYQQSTMTPQTKYLALHWGNYHVDIFMATVMAVSQAVIHFVAGGTSRIWATSCGRLEFMTACGELGSVCKSPISDPKNFIVIVRRIYSSAAPPPPLGKKTWTCPS